MRLKPVLISAIIIGGFYTLLLIWNSIEANERSRLLKDFVFVHTEDMTRLNVVAYPSTDVYTTGNLEEVQEAASLLQNLSYKPARKIKETNTYYKVQLTDTTYKKTITYIFYENNYGYRQEDMMAIGKTEYFKTDDPLFWESFYPLLQQSE